LISPREIYKRISRYSFFFKRRIIRLFFISLWGQTAPYAGINVFVSLNFLFPLINFLHIQLQMSSTTYLPLSQRVLFRIYKLSWRICLRVGAKNINQKHVPATKYLRLLKYNGKLFGKIKLEHQSWAKQSYQFPLPLPVASTINYYQFRKYFRLWRRTVFAWTRHLAPLRIFQKHLRRNFFWRRLVLPKPAHRAVYALGSKRFFFRLAPELQIRKLKKRLRFLRSRRFFNFNHRRRYRKNARNFDYFRGNLLRRPHIQRRLKQRIRKYYLRRTKKILRGSESRTVTYLKRIVACKKFRIITPRRSILFFLSRRLILKKNFSVTNLSLRLTTKLALKRNSLRYLWRSYFDRKNYILKNRLFVRPYNQLSRSFFANMFKRAKPYRFVFYWRFVRKYRAFIKVTALRNNIFFLAQRGNLVLTMHTGLFEELRHGTKRKRTQITGWYLFNKFSEETADLLKRKTTFFIDFFGKSGARSGVFKSLQHATHSQQWRVLRIRSLSPIVFNGTKARRKRRL
jgi:hypothetical protein